MTNLRSQVIRELYSWPKRKFPRRHTRIDHYSDLLQIDILEIRQYAKYNDGYGLIAMAINCFSKELYTYPLKTKNKNEVVKAYREIFRKAKTKFTQVVSDRASEFKSKEFVDLITKEQGSKFNFVYSEKKAAIVERVIGTYKRLLYKNMALRASYRWIDHMDTITETYNNTKHRTTGYKPSFINENNQHLLNGIYDRDRKRTIPKFKLNQAVRVVLPYEAFQKSYFFNYSARIYYIHKINYKYPNTYRLYDKYEQKELPRAYYAQELVPVKHEDIYLINQILKTDNKRKKLLVNWIGYPDSETNWIDFKDIYDGE